MGLLQGGSATDMDTVIIPRELIERLASARRVAVLTGAGISAESGIPTFRDALTGLWANYDPQELATPEGFARNPKLVWDWYAERRARIAAVQPQEALRTATAELQLTPSDAALHGLQAKSYSALGKHLQQHRAQAELYALQGQLVAAIQQLELAQKSADGDYFEHSQVDARLRELRARHLEEMKQKLPL